MSAIANLVINDGATTPVAHTLNPITSGTNSFYRDTVTNVPIHGQIGLRLMSKSDNGSGLNKVKLIIDVPSLEVITGTSTQSGYQAAPKVAYSNKVIVDFILPSRGTLQNRKDVLALLKNALANIQIEESVTILAPPY
jgi:hypothetical protein